MRRNRRGFQLLNGFGHSSTASPHLSPPVGPCLAQPDRSSERIVEHLTQLISEVYRMIDGCDHGVTREFDLPLELSELQAAYARIGNLRITLALHPAAIEVLTQEEAREILQIVREVLRNRVRDSHVTQATVSIRKRGARISVRIRDNGVGFVPGDGRIQNNSLAQISPRVRKIRGSMRAHVTQGRGAQLLVEFSLEPTLISV